MSADICASAGVTAGVAVCHLELAQGAVDAERVLSVLRTRRYIVDRLVLRGSECHVWLRVTADQVPLLRSRLDRLVGVQVCDEVEWRGSSGAAPARCSGVDSATAAVP